MDRNESEISSIVNQIEQGLDELKSTQVFGGDALVANEFSATLSDDASATYSLTLTPDDAQLGCLPSKLYLRWTNSDASSQALSNYYAYQVFRDDGVFEWIISGGHVSDFGTDLVLQYIGSGTVTLTRTA